MADQIRRGVLKGAAAVGAFAAVRSATAQGRSDDGPPESSMVKLCQNRRRNGARGRSALAAGRCFKTRLRL